MARSIATAQTNYIPVLTLWAFSAACLLAAFGPQPPGRTQVARWLRAHRAELISVFLVTLVAFALRFYKLGQIPATLNGDEGLVGLAAQNTRSGRLANPFALWENFGGLYLQSINLALGQLGVSLLSLRLVPAIGGTLAIPALYLLSRQVAGPRPALISAWLLAFSHTHMHFSRTVAVAYIQGAWLIPLELFLFLRGLNQRKAWLMAASAAVLALHFCVYLDSQIALGVLAAFSLIGLLQARIRARWKELAVFAGSFAILILPETYYAWLRPAQFFNRLDTLGLFQSGWLADRVALSGHHPLQILFERVAHAFLSLIYYPAFDFYGSPLPMLTLLSATLFILGLGVAVLRTRQPQYLLLNGYFWGGTLAIALFAIPPSADSYRMLVVLPAAVLLAAIGLEQLLSTVQLGSLKRAAAGRRVGYVAAVGLVLATTAALNLWAYYFQFAGQCLYGRDSSPARFASYLGSYLAGRELHDANYLLSDEFYFYGSHGSAQFLARSRHIHNFPQPVAELALNEGDVVVATPDRIGELRAWADPLPGGRLTIQYDCGEPILAAYEYQAPN